MKLINRWTFLLGASLLSACGGGDDGQDVPGDARAKLEHPFTSSLSYMGPSSGIVAFDYDFFETIGSIQNPQVIWERCGNISGHFIGGGDCRALGNEIGSTFQNLGANLEGNALSAEGLTYEAQYTRIEQRGGVIYGELTLDTSISELPSENRPAQSEFLYVLSHGWLGRPAYLLIEANSSSVPEDTYTATRIRVSATQIDPEFLDVVSGPILIEDTILAGDGRYEFSPPADSPLWSLSEPVSYRMTIEQIVSVTGSGRNVP